MSFNTSNISCDSVIGNTSLSAPLHLVDGFPITNNQGTLTFGDVDNASVACLNLTVTGQLDAPLIVIDTVTTGELLPSGGVGTDILLDGYLDAQNYGLKNVDKLTLGAGATGTSGQVLSVGATGSLYWKNDANDVANWANYTAVHNVNVGDYSLTGSNKGALDVIAPMELNNHDIAGVAVLHCTSVSGTSGGFSHLTGLATLDLLSGSGSAGQVLSLGATGSVEWKTDANDVSNWSTYNAVSDITIPSQYKINFGDTGTYIATDEPNSLITPNYFQALSFYGTDSVGTLGMLYNNGNIAKLCLTDNTGLSVLKIQKDNNTIISQTGANLSGLNNVSCSQLLPTYKLDNVYYVSSNGGDTAGTGSIENPFLTVQHAIDVCEALTTSDNEYRYIMVQAGTYNETLTITKKINLVGLGTSPFSAGVGCELGGSINISIDANGSDMFNNACCISGFLIGSVVTFDSSANSILNLENCYIYSNDDASGRALYFNPSCTNSRLRVTNCQMVSGGATGLNALMEITKSSSVTMSNVILNSKGSQNVLKFSGTATCDTINNCKFESDVVSGVAPAIVSITSTNSGTYTFTNCGFIYGDTTSKASSSVSSGICCSGGSGNPRVVILYCSFFLFGTTVANYAVQDNNYGTGTAMACLYYMNNASLTNAFAIHAILNTNKFQLNIVS